MDQADLPTARIVIADDQELDLLVLGRLLAAAGYLDVHGTTDATSLPGLVARVEPDLIAIDLGMRVLDGFELLEILQGMPVARDVPILVLTADATGESRRRAVRLGARDILAKPLDALDVVLRVRNHLAARAATLALERATRELEARVRARTADLELATAEMLDRLARAAECRDDQTGRHVVRVGRTAALLGASLGWPVDEVTTLREVAPLHDLGKIGVPDAILLKPGPLDPDEWRIMRDHTRLGARLLDDGASDRVRLAHVIARYHHERWDGDGYEGLAGDAIPTAARIVSIADVYDALTHARPYKAAWEPEAARAEILRGRATSFDPDLVDLFATFDPLAMVDPAEPAITARFGRLAEVGPVTFGAAGTGDRADPDPPAGAGRDAA